MSNTVLMAQEAEFQEIEYPRSHSVYRMDLGQEPKSGDSKAPIFPVPSIHL